MASNAVRGFCALFAAIMIASPALARFGVVSEWLDNVPQPGALVVFLVAIAGVLVGRYASRRRREP